MHNVSKFDGDGSGTSTYIYVYIHTIFKLSASGLSTPFPVNNPPIPPTSTSLDKHQIPALSFFPPATATPLLPRTHARIQPTTMSSNMSSAQRFQQQQLLLQQQHHHQHQQQKQQQSGTTTTTITHTHPSSTSLTTTASSSTVHSQARARQYTHLQAQLAQLNAHLADLENLLHMTAVQAEYIKGLGGWWGGA